MSNIKSISTLFYLTATSVISQTVLCDVGQCNTCHSSYVPQVGVPCVLVQCCTVNIRVLLIIFECGAANVFIWLTYVSHLANTLYNACLSFGNLVSW
jgi:hypothetical protein